MFLAASLASLASLAGCDPSDVDDEAHAVAVPGGPAAVAATDEVLVYSSIIRTDRGGAVEVVEQRGSLDHDVWQRVARPWSYAHEETIYHEQSWEQPEADGSTIVGYRVTATTNPEPTVPAFEWRKPLVTPEILAERDKSLLSGRPLTVSIRLRNFPEWDIPLMPRLDLTPVDDLAAALRAREDALAERAEILDEMASDVIAEVLAAGGTVTTRRWTSGWIIVSIPPWLLDDLAERVDLDILGNPDLPVRAHAWRQGDTRLAARADADGHLGLGFDGSIANGDRHTHGRLLAAVIEAKGPGSTVSGLEDEACAFFDGANCTGTSRLKQRYACNADDDADAMDEFATCEPITGFAESSEGTHGTAVAAALAGDYEDNQGCNKELNDPAYDPWVPGCHSADWEKSASGMAPEALLTYYALSETGWGGTFDDRSSDALAHAHITDFADVINNSWGWGSRCNEDVVTLAEDEVENAFDDGALIVSSAGNNDGPSSACNVDSPGDLIKSFTVNAFDASTVDCQNDFHDWCLVDQANSAKGGVTVKVDATTHTGALTAIDLVAPNLFNRFTSADGDFGDVTENTLAPGTSAAAPLVSGLALLVKHRFLANGHAWINNPGRLHTVMLAMGDRHFSTNPTSTSTTTNRKIVGGDPLYGFGRANLQTFLSGQGMDPTGWSIHVWTFAPAAADRTYFPFGPLPTGTEMVKCVMMQIEGLKDADDNISSIDLELRVRSPVNGACSSAGTQHGFTLVDNSFDSKSMVTLEDSASVPLDGKCVEVTLDKMFADENITTTTFCYRSGTMEDQ